MNRTGIGVIAGAVLGLLDGLSSWAYPEARPMLVAIVIGSTIKGVITGLVAGLIAQRWRSVPVGIAAGAAVGFVLSTLAALSQPSHYWAIVLPGMLVGAIVGVVTQRYPAGAQARIPVWALVPILASVAMTGVAQSPDAKRNELSQLDGLIGRWQGTSEGQPGNGSVEREYSRLFGTRFVQVRNRVIYKPQEKNPKGETHEDMGIFSFDTARGRLVLRQFHTEGFVNHYVADSPSKPGSLVFTTEAIENIPAGWRARETYTLLGRDALEEVFELAEPTKEFQVYSRSRLKRVP